MNQHIPNVSRDDVERIAAREFSHDQAPQILEALASYGTESYQPEVDRVHLDILKLSNGNFDRLIREIDNARCGYRDTMMTAEYPNYGKKMLHIDKLPPEERKKIIEDDKIQYETWLNK